MFGVASAANHTPQIFVLILGVAAPAEGIYTAHFAGATNIQAPIAKKRFQVMETGAEIRTESF